MNTNQDAHHSSSFPNPSQLWEHYSEEQASTFWENYEDALTEAKNIQKAYQPQLPLASSENEALVRGGIFLKCTTTPTQRKILKKLIRLKRNGIALPYRILSPFVGFPLFALYMNLEMMLGWDVAQIFTFGIAMGSIVGAATFLEERFYIKRKLKALLATQVKIKGEEILVAESEKTINLRYVDHIEHSDIGISLMPYRAQKWNTTRPLIVIPKYIEGYDEIVSYIEACIQKYRKKTT